ncbi:MAG: hypothetical protein H8E53_04730 [Planctomycetes bacterium]|nr:hypothetical protein [Planctomycetota bacterium]
MRAIKYAILLLAAVVVFSSAAEARKIVNVTDYRGKSRSQRKRDEQRRQKQLAEQRKKNAEKLEKYNEAKKKYYAKKQAEANAREKEKADKAKEAILARKKAEADAKKEAREENALLGKYATMVTEAGMSSAQRAKLVALLKKQQGGKKPAPARDNQAEIARMTKAYNEATGAKKGIIAAALQDARKKNAGSAAGTSGARADHHKQVMGLLTSAQKLKWGGYKLAKDPSLKFEGVTLTEKQLKRIRTICNAASKDLPDEASDLSPKTAARIRQSVLRRVRSQVIFEVLTPEQRTAVQSAAAKKLAAAAAAAAVAPTAAPAVVPAGDE